MYRTTITLVVLSEDPISDAMEAETILVECDRGDYVLASDDRERVLLGKEEMAEALIAAGSEPGFFQIGEEED